jgi:hypothetical protein
MCYAMAVGLFPAVKCFAQTYQPSSTPCTHTSPLRIHSTRLDPDLELEHFSMHM